MKRIKLPVKPTIYEIKRGTRVTCPVFFERRTMRFFRQTLRDYIVERTENGKIFHIQAPMPYGFTDWYYVDMGEAGAGRNQLLSSFEYAIEALEGGKA